MCEFPLSSEADLIRKDMWFEVQPEGVRFYFHSVDVKPEVFQSWIRIVRPLFEEEP